MHEPHPNRQEDLVMKLLRAAWLPVTGIMVTLIVLTLARTFLGPTLG